MSDTAPSPNSNASSNNTKDASNPVQTVLANENDILLSPVQLEKTYSESARPGLTTATSSVTSISKSTTPVSLDSTPRISIPPTLSQGKNTTKKVEKNSATATRQVKSSSSKRKQKKNICLYADCTKPNAKFVGDCNFCNGHFCSNHRLMESHNCVGLDNCKEQLHQRNADKLNKEQTIAPKIQI
ncbi:AN1-type zinc finger protein Tmc1p [Monosporozyma servazzii]